MHGIRISGWDEVYKWCDENDVEYRIDTKTRSLDIPFPLVDYFGHKKALMKMIAKFWNNHPSITSKVEELR